MSTRHFLESQLDGLKARHKKAVEDSMPVEGRFETYYQKAEGLRRGYLIRAIGTNLLFAGAAFAAIGLLDAGDVLVWSVAMVCGLVNAVAWELFWRKPRFEAILSQGVEAHEQALMTLHTVRRYDWASTRVLKHLQRIGLFLDYCNLHSVVIDGKPPVVGMTTGGDDLMAFVKSHDGVEGSSRVDMVEATIKYLEEEIQDHHETFALADRRMLPGVWNLRDAAEFLETFFQCQADLSRRVSELQEFARTQQILDGEKSVVSLVNPDVQKLKFSKEISDDFQRLAEVVEPIFSKATPIAVGDSRSEAVFFEAQEQIEAIGAA